MEAGRAEDGALRDAVMAAQEGRGTRADLEAAASAFVGQLHEQSVPPEEMLVQVKQILVECGLRPAQPPHVKGSVPTGGSLYHHVIAWCIERYYK